MYVIHEPIAWALVEYHQSVRRPELRPVSRRPVQRRPAGRKDPIVIPESPPDEAA